MTSPKGLTLVSSDSDFERMRQVREISWESCVEIKQGKKTSNFHPLN
ncbi:hypothetical protein [Nostoc sp.]